MFRVNLTLLEECRRVLARDDRIHWIVGGAGSGKSTVCGRLGLRLGVEVIDMDSRIYGTYHERFSPSRHPVSCQWSAASDGLAWLLAMTWQQFDSFQRATLPEYLDLLAHELEAHEPFGVLLIDGGICHPALLATVISPSRILCMKRRNQNSSRLWLELGERSAMYNAVMALDATGKSWERFLEFDEGINSTIAAQSEQAGIATCIWDDSESPSAVSDRARELLGL